MEGSYPGMLVTSGWKRIPRHIRTVFFSTIVFGLLAHLYIMVNLLPNHDGFLLTDVLPTLVSHGRWVSATITSLTRGMIVPWLRGVLAILYIAGTACLVADCFRVRDPLYCVLLGALMVVFPAVTSVYTYIIYVDVLMAAPLLGALGMWLTWKYKYGILPGIALIACCLGTYQSFFAVPCALAVGILLLDLLGGEASVKQTLLCGVKYLVALALGFVANLGMMWLTTQKIPLTAYQGIDKMGQIELSQLPQQLKETYKVFRNVFLRDEFLIHPTHFRYLAAALVVLVGVWVALAVVQKKLYKDIPRLLLLAILALLFPVACNVLFLADTTNMNVYFTMLYGLVMLPVLFLALLERTDGALKTAARPLCIFRKVASLGVVAILCCYVFIYIRAANITYLKLHVVHNQAQTYSTELITRIRSHEDYDTGLKIVFAGKPGKSIYLQEGLAGWDGFSGATENIPAAYSYRTYLTCFLGLPVGVQDAWPTIREDLAEDSAFQAMPVYPNAGSIAKIGDCMVVKFED